jgi:hypothetical protein
LIATHGGFLHGGLPDGFSCQRHNADGMMNDDCGFLIFEVTGGFFLFPSKINNLSVVALAKSDRHSTIVNSSRWSPF